MNLLDISVLATAGMSEMMVSVATDSVLIRTLSVGLLFFRCLLMGNESIAASHCVVS